MGQKNKVLVQFSAQLGLHRKAIRQLGSSNATINDLLIDHGLVTEAIYYWRERSEDRVKEFQKLADELEQEILEAIQALGNKEI